MLASRTSNSFQAPLLAKRIEVSLRQGNRGRRGGGLPVADPAATLATIVGAVLIPTFQRIFGRAVQAFSEHRSVPRLFLLGLSPAGLAVSRIHGACRRRAISPGLPGRRGCPAA